MEKLKFSVVIPLYNKEYSVISCIKSVLMQNYQYFEIIVINDGSSDSSVDLLESEFQKELESGKLNIYNQKNSGVSSARNRGVFLSNYDYICFLDADDEWKYDFLDNISTLIEEFSCAALYCLQHESYVDSRVKKSNNLYKNEYFGLVDDFFKRSLLGSVANSSKVCIEKKAFEEVGGFPIDQKSGEDLFVWMQVALKYPVALYNKVSTRINVLADKSREGRDVSIPYPFLYYSCSDNKRKLSFWAKVYLYKIFLMHVADSLRGANYEGFKLRVNSGKKIFPITVFFLKLLELPLKVFDRNE